MCSHHSGCDEELLLSSSELFPLWWFCSWGFWALFLFLECSWTISMALLGTLPLLTVGFAPVFPTLDPDFLQADTTLSVGLAFRQPLLEGLVLTEPFTSTHRKAILSSFCIQKSQNFLRFLPTGISRHLKILTKAPQWSLKEFGELRGCHQAPVKARVQLRTAGDTGRLWGMDWKQIPRDDF